MSKARDSVEDLRTIDADLALKAPIASPVFTGNVGIGVTPEAWHSTLTALQIGGNGSISAQSDVGSEKQIYFSQNVYHDGAQKYISTDKASDYYQENGTHTFKVAPSGTADSAISWTTAMTIDNSGYVLINSGSQFANASQISTLFDGNNVWGHTFKSSANGGAALSFLNTSNTSIGNIIVNATSTAYNTSSDYRLKTNVTPMVNATAAVKLLKPCNFDWIADGSNVNGFLAHELAEVVPEAATGTKDAMRDEEYEVTPAVLDDEGNETTAAVMGTRSVPDMQGIDQSKLVPLLTATIQELIARIEALEAGV